jgi:N-acetylneuraminic acid mutarotase
MKHGALSGAVAVASILCFSFSNAPHARELSFEERVRAQAAVESVYHSHQIGAASPFEETVSREVLEAKVRRYLAQSAALDRVWHTPVTAAMLRLELERMARGTRFPERLRELYAALGNEAFVVEECLARAVVVDRLSRNFFASDASIQKGWDEWWSGAEKSLSSVPVPAVSSSISLPDPRETARSPVTGDVWDNGLLNVLPTTRSGTALVWTGSLMVVWGGLEEAAGVDPVNTGFRYDPAIDTWTPASTVGAPEARARHVQLWTGKEVIVWGGNQGGKGLNTGGRYDPSTDTWRSMSTTGAPAVKRYGASAVWTGTEMIVWGGTGGSSGRYDPASDSWRPIATTNAPAPRMEPAVVWSGTEMIVWGGLDEYFLAVNTGGRYDPATDTWRPTSTVGTPLGSARVAAVWADGEMIVWGGETVDRDFSNGGGRYDPRLDSWTAISTAGAPQGRTYPKAVWTGSRMVLWGGIDREYRPLATGGRYDPSTDAWASVSEVNAPSARFPSGAIWTGATMIVWGGEDPDFLCLNTGGRYDPVSDSWTPTSTGGAPEPRHLHSVVWTGNEMIVWGGGRGYFSFYGGPFLDSGDRYDPTTDSWRPVSQVGAPSARSNHTAVWTGSEMIVWGGYRQDGYEDVFLDTGARYDPVTDTWRPTSRRNAPKKRANHTAVWTGSQMIVWGGEAISGRRSGGRYDPVTDTWLPTSLDGAPTGRANHTAVWTGKEMIVWGGALQTDWDLLQTGGRYDPATDAWKDTSTVDAPDRRAYHTAVWTGAEMIVWGGLGGSDIRKSGAIYEPDTDHWRAMALPDGTEMEHERHTAVWTGTQMIVWGGLGIGPSGSGEDDSRPLHTGARYDPVTDSWTATPEEGAPVARFGHTAVWTGESMIVWAGAWTNTGGRYVPPSSN